jgi:hypothetical protein
MPRHKTRYNNISSLVPGIQSNVTESNAADRKAAVRTVRAYSDVVTLRSTRDTLGANDFHRWSTVHYRNPENYCAVLPACCTALFTIALLLNDQHCPRALAECAGNRIIV